MKISEFEDETIDLFDTDFKLIKLYRPDIKETDKEYIVTYYAKKDSDGYIWTAHIKTELVEE